MLPTLRRSRFVLVLLAAVAFAGAAAAQTVPPRGTDATLDIASWNVLFFGYVGAGPTNVVLQRQNVAAVIRQAQIDLWALQEVTDTAAWNALLADLAPDGYVGVLGPDVSSDPQFNQRLGFIYRPQVVSLILTRTILQTNAFDFGGRPPFELVASVTAGGATRQIRFINLHAKAGSTLSDYNRRLAGSQALKSFTDGYRTQGIPFVVLGDFNDRLAVSITGGQLSPYRNFSTAATEYEFATRTLDNNNTPTYCSNTACTSGTPIDHILFPSLLFPQYVTGSGDRYGELLTAIPSYRTTTSDHLPVLARFDLTATTSTEAPAEAGPARLLAPSPSPFGARTALRVELSRPAAVRLEVVDALGRVVAVPLDGPLGVGTHAATLDGARLAPGVYALRLTADGQTATRRVVRSR